MGELLEDIQFLSIDRDLPEATKYASLWDTKDAKRIHANEIFRVLMEVSIRMWINRRPCLSPLVHNSLQSFADFKADMHNIYIRARKYLAQQWTKLPFIATNDVIFTLLESWPPTRRAPNLVELDKIAAQKRKDDAK